MGFSIARQNSHLHRREEASSMKITPELKAGYVSRNDALEFAERTRKNFEYIDRARNDEEDVHVVTQLINSLLGLVVFLREREVLRRIPTMQLNDLEVEGWPHVEVTKGQNDCTTLGQVLHHLRNAVAHGRIRFSSDSREMSEVVVQFEDWKDKRAKEPYVCFEMDALALHAFCAKLTRLVQQEIG